MDPIRPILRTAQLLVLDGALATELERRGADLRDPLWSARLLLDAPDLIRDVHLDYFRAGADCAITASYQATVAGFMRRGLDEAQAVALIQRSVQLAQAARDAFWADPANRPGRVRPFVAASVGPYGAFLADGSEYHGDYDLDEQALVDFHRPRMAALVAAGADMLACETIPCLAEARALVRLLREFPTTSAWISFSARDEQHTSQGEPIAECAALLDQAPQVVAIGVNCTAPRFIPGLVASMRGATAKPILVYPNSGERYDAVSKAWQAGAEGSAFADQARDWYAAGAQIIGGCCRTTPDDIRAVREVLAQRRKDAKEGEEPRTENQEPRAENHTKSE